MFNNKYRVVEDIHLGRCVQRRRWYLPWFSFVRKTDSYGLTDVGGRNSFLELDDAIAFIDELKEADSSLKGGVTVLYVDGK